MNSTQLKVMAVDWQSVTESLHDKGFAVIPGFLSEAECAELKENYSNPTSYRKTVVMERYRFGLGEYKYFNYPLPKIVWDIRESVYPNLVPVANAWMQALRIDKRFPPAHAELLKQCKTNGQEKATPLILKYGAGGYNTLHQDLYGDVYFPLQLVLFLSEPGKDYTGGQFVLTQQMPRAQSKAIVLQPQKGDMLIFTTNFRPVKGAKAYYRAGIKHGVSEVHSGGRYTLGVIFQDAVN